MAPSTNTQELNHYIIDGRMKTNALIIPFSAINSYI